MKKKNINKSIALILVIMIISLSVVGCGTSKESSSEGSNSADEVIAIKVGLISPLTGEVADGGRNQERAAKLAVDEINENGGVLNGKYKIELFSEDDAGNPSNSVTVANKLITQDGVNVIVGSLPSTCTLAIMDVTEKAKITQIAPSSTAPLITQKGNKYIFRNAASDNVIVDGLVSYAMENLDITKFAIIHETADYGVAGYNGLLNAQKKYSDIEIVAHESYTAGDIDFSVQLTKIEDAAPEAILIWGSGVSPYLAAQQIKKLGIEAQILAGTAFTSQSLFESIGEDAAGIICGTPFTSGNPDPKVQEFVQKFNTQYGYLPDMNSAQNYDAIYMIKAAVEACDSTDSTEIRDAIRNFKDFKGIAGTMNFDEEGESNKTINIVRINGGDASTFEYLTH